MLREMEEKLPPGFRFHPTDEELITFYLTPKVSDGSFTSKAIVDVDLNKSEPWDLPGKASMGEKEWYFFSLRDRKYPTGLRTNRATEAGYWKTTGKDKEIYRGGVLVGMKKTLVFYKGRAPRGEKSNWVMHEYRLQNKHPFKHAKEEWVVCRVFQKSSTLKKPQQTTSQQSPIESPCDTNSIVNEFGDIELPNLNNIANSSGVFNNIHVNPMQCYNSSESSVNTNFNNMINLNMNWATGRETPPTTTTTTNLPSLSWPSTSLLGPSLANSLIFKALQLRSYQQREGTSSSTHDYSFLSHGVSPLGTDLGSNFQASSTSPKDLDASLPQQQTEQPFNLDSVW